MLFRRNMISTKLGNMECAKPTNTAAPPVQLRSPQYAANLRRLKRGGLLLCSSRPPNWSQHNFEYYGQQLRPSHPLIEGRLIVFDEIGLEICSSVLGQTRPTTLYIWQFETNTYRGLCQSKGFCSERTDGADCTQQMGIIHNTGQNVATNKVVL